MYNCTHGMVDIPHESKGAVVRGPCSTWLSMRSHDPEIPNSAMAADPNAAIKPCAGFLVACTIFVLITGFFYGAPLAVVLFVGRQDHSPWRVLLLFVAESVSFLCGVSAVSPYHVCFGYLFGALRGWALALAGYTLGCLWPFVLAPCLAPCAFRALELIRTTWQRVAPPCGGTLLGTRGDALLDGLMLTLRERPFHVTLSLRLNPVRDAI